LIVGCASTKRLGGEQHDTYSEQDCDDHDLNLIDESHGGYYGIEGENDVD
jgi:hypothetical protein